jgi:hypothetical protein
MAGDPRVLGLLEDMLDSGVTPEEVCRDCPDLVNEVKNRWREFCQVDEALGAIFPGLRTRPPSLQKSYEMKPETPVSSYRLSRICNKTTTSLRTCVSGLRTLTPFRPSGWSEPCGAECGTSGMRRRSRTVLVRAPAYVSGAAISTRPSPDSKRLAAPRPAVRRRQRRQ